MTIPDRQDFYEGQRFTFSQTNNKIIWHSNRQPHTRPPFSEKPNRCSWQHVHFCMVNWNNWPRSAGGFSRSTARTPSAVGAKRRPVGGGHFPAARPRGQAVKREQVTRVWCTRRVGRSWKCQRFGSIKSSRMDGMRLKSPVDRNTLMCEIFRYGQSAVYKSRSVEILWRIRECVNIFVMIDQSFIILEWFIL